VTLVRGGLRRRQFKAFIADATDTLFRAGHLMTGDAGTAEDLVQETFIRIARRWDRVRVMDHRWRMPGGFWSISPSPRRPVRLLPPLPELLIGRAPAW